MHLRPSLRFPALAAAFCSLFLVAGCAKMKEATTIAKDGSGTVTMSVTVETEKLEALKMMAESMGASEAGGEDPFDGLDMKKQIQKLEKAEGIKVLSVDSTEDAEKRTKSHVVKISFDTLEHLYLSGIAQRLNVSLSKRTDGNYELTRAAASEEGMPTGEEAEMMMQGVLGMMQPYLDTMEMTTELHLPTPIVETNGAHVEGTKTVSWTVTFETLAKFASGQKQTVVFHGEGLDWKPFSLTAKDIEKAVTAREGEGEGDEPEVVPATPVTPGGEPVPEDDGMGGGDDGMGGGN